MRFDWTVGGLAEGLRKYNAAEYFAAHEEWESVWLPSQEPDKTFLQGLIQITAAFHHLQRGNSHGALRLLEAALRRIGPYPDDFGGMDVRLLCHEIRLRIDSLASADSPPSVNPVPIRPRP